MNLLDQADLRFDYLLLLTPVEDSRRHSGRQRATLEHTEVLLEGEVPVKSFLDVEQSLFVEGEDVPLVVEVDRLCEFDF